MFYNSELPISVTSSSVAAPLAPESSYCWRHCTTCTVHNLVIWSVTIGCKDNLSIANRLWALNTPDYNIADWIRYKNYMAPQDDTKSCSTIPIESSRPANQEASTELVAADYRALKLVRCTVRSTVNVVLGEAVSLPHRVRRRLLWASSLSLLISGPNFHWSGYWDYFGAP